MNKSYANNLILYHGLPLDKEDVLKQLPEAWHNIVSNLIDNLFEAGWDGDLHQVKEKFGGLRFYIGRGNDRVHDLIDEAENATTKICINCGKPAIGTSEGWITYRCADCLE